MSLVVFSAIVCAAVLTLTKGQPLSQILQRQPVQPFCTAQERNTVVRNCALSFRFHHRQYLQFLRSQPTCRSEVFDCARADRLVRCLNTQPVTSVSNRCWAMVPDVVTYLLRTVNSIPCTFDDIFKDCTATRSLLAADKRPRNGTGVQDSFTPESSGGGRPWGWWRPSGFNAWRSMFSWLG